MKKKIIAMVTGMVVFMGQVKADMPSQITSLIGGTLSSLDEQFGGLISTGLSWADACFDLNPKATTYDPCDILANLKSKASICKGKIGFDIGGFEQLCKAKTAEFSNYMSTQATALIDYTFSDVEVAYPSGGYPKEIQAKLDVNKLLNDKSATNTMGNLIKDGKMKEANVIMEFLKTSSGKSLKDTPNKVKIEDITAPKNLKEYNENMKEAINSQKTLYKVNMPTQIAATAKRNLKTNKTTGIDEEALERNFQSAIATEIGNTLATSDYKKIAIPTQEYVNRLTPDLRLGAIAQIRKQQAFETATISKISDKWERRKTQARLLVDKESIMAATFDSNVAKREIEQIANGK